jgi:DNA helicase-2/ATP-dependent DNA helicase PcrA
MSVVEVTEQKQKGLDDSQRQAVMAGEGSHLAVAGPGAGKTTCLTGRLARLIKEGVPYESILAITFSSAAAEEMRLRTARLTGIDPDKLKGTVCTFHSLGYAIIRRNRRALPFQLRYDFDPSKESTRVLKSVLYDKDLPLDGMKIKDVRSFISLRKREDKSHEEVFKEDPHNPYAIAYFQYEERKQSAGIIDFDDMIFWAWRLLRDNEEVRKTEQERYKYVMIDEFHDSDITQMKIAMTLSAPENNFYAVCDPSQSIYGWRGASPEICLDFGKFYPEHNKILLGVNYRSVPQVVDLYKEVISTAQSLIAGFLEAIKPSRVERECSGVEYFQFGSAAAEAEWVAATAKAIRSHSTDDMAILYRTNKQAVWLEQELFRAGVPYIIYNSRSFFNRAEVRDLLAFLRILDNRGDNEALERIIRSGAAVSKYLGTAFLRELASAGGDCWYDNLLQVHGAKAYQRKAARKLYDYLEGLARECRGMSVGEQLDFIFRTCGLVEEEGNIDVYERTADNDIAENMLEIIKVAGTFKDRKSFLAYVDKMSAVSERTYEGVEDPVKLMTVHRCVHPDTFVETEEGIRRIKDIPQSGRIGTPSGMVGYRQKFIYPRSEALEIITESGYSLTATANHEFQVFDEGLCVIEAGKLKRGDWLRLKMDMVHDDKRLHGPAIPSAPEKVDVRAEQYLIPKVMTAELAEFLGLIVADGTIFHRGFRIVKRYDSVVNRFCDLVEILFSAKAKRYKHGNAYAAEVDSTFLSSWLLQFDGVQPNKKQVPSYILQAPPPFQACFLRGLFEDGTVNVEEDFIDHIHWENRSLECARTVQYMLLRFGIISSVKFHKSKGHHWIASLYIYGCSVKKFKAWIGFVSNEKNKLLELDTYTTERNLSIPVSKEEVILLKDVVSKSDFGNAENRGYWSRQKVREIINAAPYKAEFLKERLRWHYVRVEQIKKTQCQSMCVEVPHGGKFFQNGFDGFNSKGLEFSTVFLVGADEDLLPHRLAEDVEEERRIAYVAISRAKDRLFVTSHSGVPSRFFANKFGIVEEKEEEKNGEQCSGLQSP